MLMTPAATKAAVRGLRRIIFFIRYTSDGTRGSPTQTTNTRRPTNFLLSLFLFVSQLPVGSVQRGFSSGRADACARLYDPLIHAVNAGS
jgi:hypothetical protein